MNLNDNTLTFTIEAISLEKSFVVLPVFKMLSPEPLLFSIQKASIINIPVFILKSSSS
jgi:hypothetical protein